MQSQTKTLFTTLLAVTVLSATSTFAQPSNPPYFQFFGSCVNGENRLGFAGSDHGGYEHIVGFDIYRSPTGTCADATRITDVPIPRSFNQDFSHEIIDSDIVDGSLYGYRIYGVNADRATQISPHYLYPDFGSTDHWFAGCNAMAGRGTIVDWGWTVAIQPCSGSCQPGFYLETGADELRPYIGLVVSVYGTFGWSIEGLSLDLESYEFAGCVVAVEESGWSNIKSLFR